MTPAFLETAALTASLVLTLIGSGAVLLLARMAGRHDGSLPS